LTGSVCQGFGTPSQPVSTFDDHIAEHPARNIEKNRSMLRQLL
jgi:hypothetical protein